LVVLFRSLAALQSAGVPLVSCFDALGQTVENQKLRQVCQETGGLLSQGHPLSSCFRKHPEVFAGFHNHLIAVGEETGNLSQVLGYIATFEESRERLMQRIRSALIYPTLVAVTALLGLVFVLPFVLEGVFEVIRDSGAEPPLLTKAVMAISSFMSSPLGWLAVPALFLAAYKPVKKELTSLRCRPFLLSLPGLGNCLRRASSARYAGALSLCLRSGLSVQRSLALSARATGDPLLEHGVKSVKRAVEEGSTLSEALQSLGFFTPLFVEIVASGEEVGRTEEMLAWLAEGLEKDLEQDLQTYAALLEPIMLLAVGVVVGVIVIATASPMLNLIQTLG
jgi:MSHA biogenesis protein MshG